MSTTTFLSDIQARAAEQRRVESLVPEPKCPECGCGVNRPKCMWEMGGACPRHEVHAEWQDECRRVDRAQKEAARPGVERSMDGATL